LSAEEPDHRHRRLLRPHKLMLGRICLKSGRKEGIGKGQVFQIIGRNRFLGNRNGKF
jgi:hypothetical protein